MPSAQASPEHTRSLFFWPADVSVPRYSDRNERRWETNPLRESGLEFGSFEIEQIDRALGLGRGWGGRRTEPFDDVDY